MPSPLFSWVQARDQRASAARFGAAVWRSTWRSCASARSGSLSSRITASSERTRARCTASLVLVSFSSAAMAGSRAPLRASARASWKRASKSFGSRFASVRYASTASV